MPILHYKTYGSPSTTPPIMLLHGLLGELENWQTQAKKLAQHHHVISVDLRNHGHSPHLKGMSYREMSEDIQHLLTHLNIPKIHLLGHSMGGKVAMYLALNHPELIEKLIIVDISPKSYPLWHQQILQGMLQLPLETFTSRKAIDEAFSHTVSNAYERGFLLKNLQRTEAGRYQWKCDLNEISRNYLKIAGFPVIYQQYKGRVLFIKGGRSDYIVEEDQVLIGRYFSDNEIRVIAESGHLSHVEQVDEFYGVIESVLL